MLDIQVKAENLDQTTRAVLELPGIFARARASALKSVGYEVQQDLKREGRQLVPKLNPHTGILSQTRDQSGRKRGIGWKGRYKSSTITWSNAGRSGGSSGAGNQRGLVKRRLSTRLNPFARFVNMMRYSVDAEENFVEIGILNPKPIYYVWFRKNVEGFSTPVTQRMRKFFFSIGFPLRKETTSLKTPPRPWINKVGEKWAREAAIHFEKQFWSALQRYREGGKS